MNPTISIIVPIYKVEPYLRKCLDSILNQTFRDFELILVNDGSPDGCGEICEEYAKKDKRVKVQHKENGGAFSAYNAGLDIAIGDYIGIVDGDDFIERDMYETLYRLTKEHNADVVECGMNVVSSEGLSHRGNHGNIEMGNNIFALQKLLEFPYREGPCTKLYKKELFKDLRFPDKLYEDSYLIYKIFYKLNKYVFIGESKYNYVKRADSTIAQQKKYSLSNLQGLELQIERYYFFKEKTNDQSILRMQEYRLFNYIMLHYEMLQINKKLDLKKKNREMIRSIIYQNKDVFLKNEKLKKHSKIIFASNQNINQFDMIFAFNRYYEKSLNNISKLKYTLKSLLS